MGIQILEMNKIREKRYKRETQLAKRLGLKASSLDELRLRRDKLNKSKFKSESWFQNKLELQFQSNQVVAFKNHPILNKFFADFYFPDLRIAVEIDGSSHNGKQDYDSWRDNKFSERGIKTIRVQAYNDLEAEKCLIELKKLVLSKPNVVGQKKFKKRRLKNKRKKKSLKAVKRKERDKKLKVVRGRIFAQKRIKKNAAIKKRDAELLWGLGKGPSPYAIK